MHKKQPQTPERIPVDLGFTRPQVVRLLIQQTAWSPHDWVQHDGLYFLKDARKVADQLTRTFTQAQKSAVDVIVLPELSVPADCIGIVQAWSGQTGATVIAGSHYYLQSDGGYVARCPVVVAGKVFFVEKLTPAPVEISPIQGQGLQRGRTLPIFRNSNVGNFAVLICSDYLDDASKTLLELPSLDILFVPAFQRKSDLYHAHMHLDCVQHEAGMYIAYANASCKDFGDGCSSLFGTMDRLFLDRLLGAGLTDGNPSSKVVQMDETQSHLIVDLNLETKRPFANRTVHTRPNISVVEFSRPLNARGNAFIEKIAHNDKRYVDIDELFVEPIEFVAMRAVLDQSRLLFIVGDPGMGKTYCAVKLMKQFFELGYDPVWYAGLEKSERADQRQVLETFRPRTRQVIYFEDPFGRTVFEKRDSLQRVFGPLADHLRETDARVIITSRKEIFEQFSKEVVTTIDIQRFTQEMNVVKPSYSSDALVQILRKLAHETTWYNDDTCRASVVSKIQSGTLKTPLAIQDFVFSVEHLADKKALLERLQRRGVEERRMFSEDIQANQVPAKITLSLVFLFGAQVQATLSEWFNQVASFLCPERHWAGPGPFMYEVRAQLGYRLEQYGHRASVLRFVHPCYEEAFAESAVVDPVTAECLSAVAKRVARSSLRIAAGGVLRHIHKYPNLSLHLTQDLVPVVRGAASLADISYTGLRLVAAYDISKNRAFLDSLAGICSLSELAGMIAKESDVDVMSMAFRFCFNYGDRASGVLPSCNEWRRVVDDGVDWDTLLLKWAQEDRFGRLIDCLYWCARVAHSKVSRFLHGISDSQLKAKVNSLTPGEIARFDELARRVSLAYNPPALVHARQHGETPKASSRSWLLSNPLSRCAIVVDDGALAALRNKRSLLPVGITEVIGDFGRDEAVPILDETEAVVGVGLPSYTSEEIRLLQGHHSRLIEQLVLYKRGNSVVRKSCLSLSVAPRKRKAATGDQKRRTTASNTTARKPRRG